MPPPPPGTAHVPLGLSPADSIPVNPSLSILPLDGFLVYFHGLLPVHSHPADSPRDRDRVLSMLVSLGTASVAQLARALGLSERTVGCGAVECHFMPVKQSVFWRDYFEEFPSLSN